jgi:hypothetical protein
VCFHDKCFDGAASAAVFCRFYRERIHSGAEFAFTGMTHQAKHPFTEELFDGDENAIVDFKYATSSRVTWWFDHHQSAFLKPEDAEHFQGDTTGRKFYDPQYKSCTKFIATVAQQKFGFDPAPLAELIHWGDVIDGAQYPDPESAVSLREPATQLALVIEAAPVQDMSPQVIPHLASRPLAEIVQLPFVAEQLGPLRARHERTKEVMKKRAVARNGVVFFDISEDDLEGYNKFIPYWLNPQVIYSVGVSLSPTRAKVSVGTNPWNVDRATHNLASICERYGGGGHARVAAISLEPGDIARAREIAAEIAAELRC